MSHWPMADRLSYLGTPYIKQDEACKEEWRAFVKNCVKNYEGGIEMVRAIIGIMRELSELPKERQVQITGSMADRYDFLDLGQGDLVTSAVAYFHERGAEYLQASKDFNSETKELAIAAKMRGSSREVFSAHRYASDGHISSEGVLGGQDEKEVRLDRLRREQ